MATLHLPWQGSQRLYLIVLSSTKSIATHTNSSSMLSFTVIFLESVFFSSSPYPSFLKEFILEKFEIL